MDRRIETAVPPNIIASSSGKMLFRAPILPVSLLGWTRSYNQVPTVANIYWLMVLFPS